MSTVTRTTDRREARRERTRAQIVAAAWELAARDGIAALSLRDLAERVGMRAPSLYGYFDGKDAIYDAMFTQGYEALDAEIATVVDQLSDLGRHEQLARSATTFLRFCAEDLPRYQLMFTRVIPGWQPSPEAYATSVASFGRMVEWLGAIGITDPRAIDLWTAVTAGLAAQQAANDPGGDRYVQLAADAAAMFLHHLDDPLAPKEPS